MIGVIDPIEKTGSENQEERGEKHKDNKMNDTLSVIVSDNIDSRCKTRVVEHDVPPFTNYDDTNFGSVPSNNLGLPFDKRGKKNNKNASNNKPLIHKLILSAIDGMERIKNIRNVRSNLRHIPQTIIGNDGFDNNTAKEKEEQKQQQEQIEVHTKSGYSIIIGQNPCSGLEKIVIRDNSNSSLRHNNSQEKTNSIEIDASQNSVSITTGMNLCIEATNINIEANEAMSLKSGSTMTINGSLVKIN